MKREEHMVHLYAPGCLFREDTRKSAIPRQETYMRFKGGEVCGLTKFIGENRRFCRFLDEERKIGEILDKAAVLCSNQGEGAYWEIQSLLVNCISVLLNSSSKISDGFYTILEERPASDLFVENVEAYIRGNIGRNIQNSEIAEYMNLSASTFNHAFKEATGVSPKTRNLEIKVATTKGLLLKGKCLKEIAELTGFYDEFHFSKTFKRVTGISPAEYRNKKLKD